MTKDLSPKKVALQRLLALAEDRSFNIYETDGDIYGDRSWSTEWSRELNGIEKCSAADRQNKLNETLLRLRFGNQPKTVKQLRQEQSAIRLTLQAGADPNCSQYYCSENLPAFEGFWNCHKRYGLLELVKDSRFKCPTGLQTFYNGIYWYPRNFCFSKEENEVNQLENDNMNEIIYTLFQKRMYPTDSKVFEKLVPIILEKDPNFFEKERQRTMTCLQKAKTPIQFWAAITGQQKEKN